MGKSNELGFYIWGVLKIQFPMPLAWQAVSFPLTCHALRVSLPRASHGPAKPTAWEIEFLEAPLRYFISLSDPKLLKPQNTK